MRKSFIASLFSIVLAQSNSWAQSVPQNIQENDMHVSSSEFQFAPLVSPGSTVLLIGDSLAVGMSKQFSKSALEMGYVPLTHTIVGTTASQWVNLLKKDIEEKKPSLVVISLGTNDATGRIEWIRSHSGIFALITRIITNSGAQYVWIGSPSIDSKKIPNMPEVTEIIKTSIHNYFDSSQLMIPKAKDGIHSTPTGYNSWMIEVWSWMLKRNIVGKGGC